MLRVYCLPHLFYRADQACKLESLQQILFEDLFIGPALSREKNEDLQGGEGKTSATQKNAVANMPTTAGFCSLAVAAPCNAVSEETTLTKYLLIFYRTKLVPCAIPVESMGLCKYQRFISSTSHESQGPGINVNNTH